MEQQILELENKLGFINYTINLSENEQERVSLEDKYSMEVYTILQQLEQLKNN